MTQPPVAVPVCYRHPARETYISCTRCERPICPDCMIEASVGHQCPDCVAAGRRIQRPVRTVFGGTEAGSRGHVTMTLVAVNVAVAVLALFAGGTNDLAGNLMGGGNPLVRYGGLLSEAARISGTNYVMRGVADGEYYRLFTSMFLHYGLFHLAMNMWALWVLGRNLEAAFGPVRFLGLYLLSGFGGSVAVYLFGATNALTVGASGAIFGLFAALFIALRRLGKDAASIIPVLVINLVITFTIPGISKAGHLGGLVTGAVVAVGLAYAPQAHRRVVQVGVSVLVAAGLILATILRTAMIAGGTG